MNMQREQTTGRKFEGVGAMKTPMASGVWKSLSFLALFAIAMGLLEAICVIYLRRLYPVSGWASTVHVPPLERLHVEVIREACTLIMLVAVAWLSGINHRSRLACFFYAFGLWDIFYYVGLKWLAGWPASWLDWDCLFLIPKPWYGPVLAPVVLSVYFAGACLLVHAWEARRYTSWLSYRLMAGQLVACALWYWSFVKDADIIRLHGYSKISYSWSLLVAGLLVALASFWWTSRACRSASVPSPRD